MSVLSTWRWQYGARVAKALSLVILFLLAMGSGAVVAQRGVGFDYRVIISLLVVFALFAAVAAGRRMWEPALYFWILTFALGYRTFHVNNILSIHPSEVFIWLLFASLLSYKMTLHRMGYSILPRVGWLFAGFWLFGVVRAVQVNVPISWILESLLPVLALIPIFALVKEIVDSPSKWRTIGGLMTLVTFYIAFFGVVEYYVPSAVAPFHGFFVKAVAGTTVEGFERAAFSFWGSPVVAQILVLFLPMLLAQWSWWRGKGMRAFLLITFAFTLVAIYIAGYRTVWYVTVFELALFFLLRGNWKVAAMTLLGVALGSAALPLVARERALNLLVEGFASDSSAANRLQRLEGAWGLFGSQPMFGYGWGRVSFVHNDILQLAVTLGAIGLLFFVVWYAYTFVRLWRVYRSPAAPWVWEEAVALLTFLVGFLVMLFTQALIEVAQLIIPLWFLFALANHLPDRLQADSMTEAPDAQVVRVATHLQ